MGIAEPTLRAFGVGYAPGDTRRLPEHLATWGHSARELASSGLASLSERGHLHVLFHARIVFPIGSADGRVLGFAGLATHLGPSWPLWLTSPDSEQFSTSSAIFGLRQASASIGRAGRALVLRDCVQVLALHEEGRREAVAIIHSPITRAHLDQLAVPLRSDRVQMTRHYGRMGVVVVPPGSEVSENAFASQMTPAGFMVANPGRGDRSDAERRVTAEPELRPSAPARAIVYVAGLLTGVGIPIGLLLLATPPEESTADSTSALNLVVLGVATTYLVLTIAVARISARVRARERRRRMRAPWARGSGEYQPAGWTYHRLEEILVGAALVSVLVCLVLWIIIGGSFG